MRRVLILFTASYPYGSGETFVAHEVPYLAAAFDEVVVVSNSVDDELSFPVPPGVSCVRHPYELSGAERLGSASGLARSETRHELQRVREQYGLTITPVVRNTVLVSWAKARKFARLIRRLVAARSDARVDVYSYWANDMALAAALARSRGWVERAVCRAHGWDVYFERAESGFLPFRSYLAEHLDHYLFVSENGLAYFREREGRDFPSLRVHRLGTPPVAPAPVAARAPFLLVSCSSMIPLKRVELIGEALRDLEHPLTWLHIGDGPTRARVEAACRGLGEHVRVELPGEMPNPDVLALYRSRRPSAFINVSATEGVPVAIMEAMGAGIPVIATDVGGVGEIVRHGSNGVLLPPDPTAGQVGAAIRELIAMPEGRYEAMAGAAWDTWDRDYNGARNHRRLLEDVFDLRTPVEGVGVIPVP